MSYKPGDEVMFYNTKYTLIEPTGQFGFLAVETDNARAKMKVILTEYFKPVVKQDASGE